MRLVLVHSPYLGPASWEPTALELRAQGFAVDVPDLRASLDRLPCAASFIAAMGTVVDRCPGPTILVGHSRSGPFLPAAADGRQSVVGLVYVDAPLPYPGRSWADQASPERAAAMRRRVVAGRLPKWSDWWDDPTVIDRLVPDPTLRARMIEEMPRVPSSFLDEQLSELSWSGAAAYLQLSEEYAGYADGAQSAGWAVTALVLDHFAIVTSPTEVASAVAKLVVATTSTHD